MVQRLRLGLLGVSWIPGCRAKTQQASWQKIIIKKIETRNRSHIVTNLIKTKKRERRREKQGSYKTVEQPLQRTEAKKVKVEFYSLPTFKVLQYEGE